MKQIGIKLLKTKKLRWEDVDNGESKYDIYYEPDREYLNGSFLSTPEEYDMWRIFYSTERGHNLEITNKIKWISSRPILFITGDEAHSKKFSIDAYNNANEPKYFYQVNMSTTHIDLYDNVTMIPFDKIDSFLNESLEKEYHYDY